MLTTIIWMLVSYQKSSELHQYNPLRPDHLLSDYKQSFAYLNALLCKIFTCSRLHVCDHQSITERLNSPFHGNNTPSTFSRYIEVVCYSSCRYFQHTVWSCFIEKYITQCWQKSPRWATENKKCNSKISGYFRFSA